MHLPIRKAHALAGALALTAGLGAAAVPASAASLPGPVSASHITGKYCVSLPAPGGQGQSSPQALRYCSNQNDKATGLPANFHNSESLVVMVVLWSGTYHTGQYMKLLGPGCQNNGQQTWDYINLDGYTANSWEAFNSCWATTLYTGQDGDGAKFQYAQGVYNANQIGSPWAGNVGTVWTGYKR